jgi:peptidoglycan hydrolase-like protein with peptidoglycan-binding domain
VSRARLAASGAAGIAVLALGVTLGAGAGDGAPAAATTTGAATATARVERRDLVDRETVAGTLGYGDAATLRAGASGTLTGLRAPGTVVRRGAWLMEVDGRRTGWLLYGRRPAWRDFAPGMSAGADVRQLEANLRALGHDPGRAMTVDGTWDWATTAAVRRLQEARGLDEDGTLAAGEVLFRPGAVRIGEAKAAVGDRVGPGAPLGEVTGTRRVITVDLDADRQGVARRGAAVRVTLPDGRAVRGRVAEVGTVARPGEEEGTATITVRVRLLGRAARGGGYDQAPVDVGFERERASGRLTVPVTALLAESGGGYAVEVVDGAGRRRVPVRTGLTADGLIAVHGDLREGQRVVVPA